MSLSLANFSPSAVLTARLFIFYSKLELAVKAFQLLILHITFVSDKNECHIRISILTSLIEPSGEMIEGITSMNCKKPYSETKSDTIVYSPSNIIDKESTSS
jgi:hypothetical protein